MNADSGMEYEITQEHYLGAKSPTYDQIRPFAFRALQKWLKQEGDVFAQMDSLALSKVQEDKTLSEDQQQKASLVWRVRLSWMKAMKAPNENSPQDKQFVLTHDNQPAVLFILKMLKDQQDPASEGFKKWALTAGITIPLSYEDIALPENFLAQITKRRDLQRKIIARKTAEKQKAAV